VRHDDWGIIIVIIITISGGGGGNQPPSHWVLAGPFHAYKTGNA
jgi:hypothetical protein